MTDDTRTETIVDGAPPARGDAGGEPTDAGSVQLNGSRIEIGPGTTVADLRETTEVGADEVFTHRSDDGIHALTDDDVVADHVDPGARLRTQPLADSEVFGA